MKNITRLLICCFALVSSAYGCSWDSGTYEEYVKNNRVTKCEGICLKDEAISEDSCKGDGLHWNKAHCTDPTGMIEGIDQFGDDGACINAGGIWAEASCEVTSEFGCYKVKGEWTELDYEILDLGNGKYIRKVTKDGDKASYICGPYNAVVTEKNAETCKPDAIEKFKRALEHHLCTADASNCVPPLYFPEEGSVLNSTLSANAAMCSECPSGMAQCLKDNKYQCVDLLSDTMNCGSCGNNCGKGTDVPVFCENGSCRQMECSGYLCQKDDSSWYCLDPSDVKSCGATKCGQEGAKCAAGETCEADNAGNYACKCLGDVINDGNTKRCIDPSQNSSCGANKTNPKGTDCAKGLSCKQNSKGQYECLCSDNSDLTCKNDDGEPICIDTWSDKYCGATNCNNLEEFRCSPSEQCNQGVCICQEGFAHCNGECVDPWNSPRYCGAKGNCSEDLPNSPNYKGEECSGRRICSKSRCECDKDAGYVSIKVNDNEDICVHPSDNDYCGIDGKAQDINSTYEKCRDGKVCREDKDNHYSCQCPAETFACNFDGKIVCTDPNTDAKHCGIGDNCKGGEDCTLSNKICVNGHCSKDCPPGQIMCDSKCISTSEYAVNDDCTACTDEFCPISKPSGEFNYQHCKREFDNELDRREKTIKGGYYHCGTSCDAPSCGVNAECKQSNNGSYSCQCANSFYENCYGNCLILSEKHMTKCEGQDKCEAGWGDCDDNIANGCETRLDNSADHCGACGNSCSKIATNAFAVTCENSKCKINSCISLYGNCDNNVDNGCETTLISINHCGVCNNQCNEKYSCDSGECCMNDNIVISTKPTKCCNTNARIWQYYITVPFWGDVMQNNYQCSTSDPSGWYGWDYEQWKQID
ncbi:MAG: hypothetical protein IJU23_05365 [Proteobacteria bacterium]|nr:hypothetical protein [Pseudomonadota bacterium]